MKSKTITLLVLAASCCAGFAATVALNKGLSPGFTVQNTSGTATASFLFIGSFSTAPTTPLDGNYQTIITSFRSFDVVADAVSIGSGAVIGATAASWANTPSTPANFNGLQMYMLVSNNADYTLATQFGLFTNSPATNFVADTTTATSSNYNVGTFASNVVVAGAGVMVDNATGADVMKLVNVSAAAVPEPSAVLLGAIGALGLLRRRRN